MSQDDAVDDATDAGDPPAALDGVANVLILAPSMHDGARRAYFEQFFPDQSSGLDVLAATYRQAPDEWLDEWQRYVGDWPRRCLLVSVDDVTRSAAATADRDAAPIGPNTAVCVESPADLTGLGIRINEFLSAASVSEAVVTIDTLTVLLQYVETARAFRFLHVLTTRVKNAGAVAHYHVDPAAHSERTVATVSSLFDTTAEFEDGSWSIRRQ